MSDKKTYFQKCWLQEPDFKPWLQEDSSNLFFFHCKVCKKSCSLANKGIGALKTHMKGDKHREKMKLICGSSSQDTIISHFKPLQKNREQVAAASGSSVSLPSSPSTSDVPISSLSVPPPPSPSPVCQSQSTIQQSICKDDVLKAEILWAIKVISDHYSCASSEKTGKLFTKMFPDSQIAKKFACGSTKCSYLIKYGLAPYFMGDLKKKLSSKLFVVSFDEALKKKLKHAQMDFVICFWDNQLKQVVTRYFTSEFLGQCRAIDLLAKFKSGLAGLNCNRMLQISMDGPATNWSFYDSYIEEQNKDKEAPQVLELGSCGIHVVHGAFKSAIEASGWTIDSILRSMYYLFKDSPARSMKYEKLTSEKRYAMKFCTTQWLEDVL